MKKKLISIFATVAMLFSLAAPAMASDPVIYPELVIQDGIRYEVLFDTVSNSSVICYGAQQEQTSIVIPATIKFKSYDLTVTKIGNLGAYKESLTSVGIEGSPSISRYAFDGCTSLQYIEFWGMRSPEVEPGAFDNIADGVQAYVMMGTIGTGSNDYNPNKYPFINGSPLRLIGYDYPEIATTVVGGVEYLLALPSTAGVNGTASAVRLVDQTMTAVEIVGTIPDPNGGAGICEVKEVASGAFSGTGIQSVQFPSTLETIGTNAFKNCAALSSVTFLGTTCPAIAEGAFDNIAFGAKAYVPSESLGTEYARQYPFDRVPLVLNGYTGYPQISSISVSQKSEAVLMPGVEYPLSEVMDMIYIQVDLDNALIATPGMYSVALSDPSGTNATAVVTDDTFTIVKDGTIRLTVTTVDGLVETKDFQMTVTTRQTGKKSSIQNSPQNSSILKGQFQMSLSAAQQAELGDTYDVSFYYRVDPNTIMHNFMVYNTDGTMMADKIGRAHV